MKELLEEYRNDLKTLKKLHQAILAKRYQTPVLDDKGNQIVKIVNGEAVKVFKLVDDRTPRDISDQKTIAEAITTTGYALFWLETGREKPFDDEQAKKIPKHRRAVKCADIDVMSYQVYLQEIERPTEKTISDEKKEMLLQLTEIETLLSDKELELFHLINKDLCTYGEAAEQMNLAVGTVKSMSQRIKNKIENYFEYGHQMDLFAIC